MTAKAVFIPRKESKKKTPDMGTIMGNKPQKGEVGLEIEIEGKKLPVPPPAPWRYIEDHSLRAPKGGMTAEYVLAYPIDFKEVKGTVEALWDGIAKNGGVIMDSNRTSVHVHLNCQKWFLNRVTSFAALYFIVEEILTEWCGDHRVGNLFCLRAKDAEAIVSHLKTFIEFDGQAGIQEFLHYSALNANALKKYGSLEIRTLSGTNQAAVVVDWVETLERLYRLSEDFPDPRDICSSLSSVGPLAFFNNILGPKAEVIRKGISMSDHDIANSVYEGVRIAQELCYCKDWDAYSPMKLKPDRFGRPLSGIAKKIMNMSSGGMTATPSMPGMPQGPVTYADVYQAVADQEQAPYEEEYPMFDDEED